MYVTPFTPELRPPRAWGLGQAGRSGSAVRAACQNEEVNLLLVPPVSLRKYIL